MQGRNYEVKNEYNKKNKTKEIVITALFTALTFAATWLIDIKLPLPGSGGLIHLGNVPLFLAAAIYGRKTGAVAGAFGMGLFDLMSGWTLWAPFTFLIVGLMGYTIGVFAEKKPFKADLLNYVIAFIIALIIKITGYYFAEVIILKNWITPFGSILGNVLQIVFASIIVLIILPQIKKISEKMEV